MRIRGAVAGAEAGAAGRRRVPPLQHVALEELLARRAAGSAGGPGPAASREQGQHVLELVAKAEGAAALVGAAAAPEARGQQLVGQPVVDQPVERRLVGLDPQIAQRVGPDSAWSPRAPAWRPPATRSARPIARLSAGPAPDPAATRHLGLAAGRHLDRAGEAGDAPAVVAGGRVARPCSTRVGPAQVAARRRPRSGSRTCSCCSTAQRRGHERPAAVEVVARVAK